MSGTSYLSLVSGARIKNYLGLQMDEGRVFTYPPTGDSGYGYVQIPAARIVDMAGEPLVADKALRNQAVRIVPACSVDIKGSYRFEVHPNPALWDFGAVQGVFYLEPGEGRLVPSFVMNLRKDLTLTDIPWAIRIYMRA